ncbi:class I SAM-dependent methyltransferase [uncultured Thiodictyon sp.]|jgi:SAM-dependent methyltransferase/ribosomal protein S27AE|uniref:class I SAM-dependent methyltransferase n=1 Tax=uncultured Thiodictyon sp. TaxID=1846217 RepID=UPI0025E7E201|nr:class I SAM-dependent methyltransferase [uncultured Thiodictyon sp.]
MRQDHKLLSLVTRCVECAGNTMTPGADALVCGACGYRYEFSDDGVLRALPRTSELRVPAFYQSRFYRRWMSAWEDMVQKGWVIYERPFYRFFSMSGHRKMRSLIAGLPHPPEVIVDIGCGDGQLFDLLDQRRCIGIDRNAAFLTRVKHRYPDVLAVQADFNNLPFAPGSIACCTSAHVLEHLYHLAEGLEEVRRVLAPAGAFIFSIPTEGGWGWELGRLLVTGPRLRRNYRLNVHEVMAIEHINDARRVLQFARFYFDIRMKKYAPLSFLPVMAINSSITVLASPLAGDHELRPE